jgi:hypothetical protein
MIWVSILIAFALVLTLLIGLGRTSHRADTVVDRRKRPRLDTPAKRRQDAYYQQWREQENHDPARAYDSQNLSGMPETHPLRH